MRFEEVTPATDSSVDKQTSSNNQIIQALAGNLANANLHSAPAPYLSSINRRSPISDPDSNHWRSDQRAYDNFTTHRSQQGQQSSKLRSANTVALNTSLSAPVLAKISVAHPADIRSSLSPFRHLIKPRTLLTAQYQRFNALPSINAYNQTEPSIPSLARQLSEAL